MERKKGKRKGQEKAEGGGKGDREGRWRRPRSLPLNVGCALNTQNEIMLCIALDRQKRSRRFISQIFISLLDFVMQFCKSA